MLAFLGTKLGGYIAIALAALSAVSVVLLRAFNAGKRSEVAKQNEAQIKAVKERNAVDEDVARLDDDSIRQRLRDRWRR